MSTFPNSLSRLAQMPPRAALRNGPPVLAVTRRQTVPSRPPVPHQASLFTLPGEPEDARITGGTRSLDRRLLALNLAGTLRKAAATIHRATALPTSDFPTTDVA